MIEPYYQDKWHTIYCGDCREILPLIGAVDALVTDPPFGIGHQYEKRELHNNHQEYWDWLAPIYYTCLARVRSGGFVAVWQTQLYYRYLWDWFGDNIHIYAAAKNFVQMRKVGINYGYDPVVTFFTAKPELRPEKPKRSIDFFVANTAKWVTQTDSIIRQHPCPRPIDQVIEIVRNFTLPGGYVLDPFLGSGTTAVACSSEGRHCVGIEQEEKYCEIAKQRCIEQSARMLVEGTY